MSDFTYHAHQPSFAQAFLSAITPEEHQTTAYACAPEFRTTSVRGCGAARASVTTR